MLPPVLNVAVICQRIKRCDKETHDWVRRSLSAVKADILKVKTPETIKISNVAPIDVKTQEFLDKHEDFLREKAMEVFSLVSTEDNMVYFRKQIELFLQKVKDLQTEREQFRKDYEKNSKLKEAARKLDEQIKSEPVNERGSSELRSKFMWTAGFRMLDGFEEYVCYGDFWGPVEQTSDLISYLKSYPDYELPEFKMPNAAEKLICSYALLSVIHDKSVPDKPILDDDLYFLNNSYWGSDLERLATCYTAISQGMFGCAKDTQAWIERALAEVKTDLAKKPVAIKLDKKKTKKAKKAEKKYHPWANPGDACFVLKNSRVFFRYKTEDKNLKLSHNSRAYKLLYLFAARNPLSQREIKELCTANTRPSDYAKAANETLNKKIAAFGLSDIRKDIAFVKFKDSLYGLQPPIKFSDADEKY